MNELHVFQALNVKPSDAGAYKLTADRAPWLTADEERDLGWSLINDHSIAARDRLVHSNMRLVVAATRHYADRGVSATELLAAGHRGLMQAVDEFDPAFGARFSTGANWWIRQSIKRRLLDRPDRVFPTLSAAG